MIDFTPDPAKARSQIADYKEELAQLVPDQTQLDHSKSRGDLIAAMVRERGVLSGQIELLRPVVHRLISFLPEPERAATLKSVLDAEKLAGMSGP